MPRGRHAVLAYSPGCAGAPCDRRMLHTGTVLASIAHNHEPGIIYAVGEDVVAPKGSARGQQRLCTAPGLLPLLVHVKAMPCSHPPAHQEYHDPRLPTCCPCGLSWTDSLRERIMGLSIRSSKYCRWLRKTRTRRREKRCEATLVDVRGARGAADGRDVRRRPLTRATPWPQHSLGRGNDSRA